MKFIILKGKEMLYLTISWCYGSKTISFVFVSAKAFLSFFSPLLLGCWMHQNPAINADCPHKTFLLILQSPPPWFSTVMMMMTRSDKREVMRENSQIRDSLPESFTKSITSSIRYLFNHHCTITIVFPTILSGESLKYMYSMIGKNYQIACFVSGFKGF